jgi:hypothetical protein
MYLSIRKVTGIKHIFSFTNKYTHVTIDTVDDSVKHFQANTVCELALSGIIVREKKISPIFVSLIWKMNGIVKAF